MDGMVLVDILVIDGMPIVVPYLRGALGVALDGRWPQWMARRYDHG